MHGQGKIRVEKLHIEADPHLLFCPRVDATWVALTFRIFLACTIDNDMLLVHKARGKHGQTLGVFLVAAVRAGDRVCQDSYDG